MWHEEKLLFIPELRTKNVAEEIRGRQAYCISVDISLRNNKEWNWGLYRKGCVEIATIVENYVLIILM